MKTVAKKQQQQNRTQYKILMVCFMNSSPKVSFIIYIGLKYRVCPQCFYAAIYWYNVTPTNLWIWYIVSLSRKSYRVSQVNRQQEKSYRFYCYLIWNMFLMYPLNHKRAIISTLSCLFQCFPKCFIPSSFF